MDGTFDEPNRNKGLQIKFDRWPANFCASVS